MRSKRIYCSLLTVGLAFIGLALLSACMNNIRFATNGFPSRAIVFISRNDPLRDYLDFIQPDGSGLVTQVVSLGPTMSPPTWNLDGTLIAVRSEAGGSSYFSSRRAQVLSTDGRLYNSCQEWQWDFGRIWITSDGKLLMTLYTSDKESAKVVLADFRSCQIITTLYTAQSPLSHGTGEDVDSAALSVIGDLAVGRLLMKDGAAYSSDILLVDPKSGTSQIVGHGLAPAWSKDGHWLAYTGIDGIYVLQRDTLQSRKVANMDSSDPKSNLGWSYQMPVPSWSPDGKYLVYHRITADGPIIYKLEISTGIETEVFRGGLYPAWRWDLPTTNN